MISDFPLEPYGVRGYFTTDREAFEKLTTFNTAGCTGMTARWEDAEGALTVAIGLFDPTALHFLAHECGHAALAVADHCGFEPDCGNGEPLCYLIGYLFQQCQSRLPCPSAPSLERLH